MRRGSASLLVVAAALAGYGPVASPALAHLGAPEGRRPFIEDGALLGGGTTWGIIEREDDRWLRVCEESLGGPPAFYFRLPTSGRVLIGRADGLWLTDDGCSLDPGPALFSDAQPALLAQPLDVPGTLFVATAKADGDNGLYVSTDEGQSFTGTGLMNEDASLRSIAVSSDGQDLYVGGIWLDSRAPVIFVSRDGGVTFTEAPAFSDTTAAANVLAIDDVTSEVAIVLLDEAAPGSTLMLADPDVSALSELAVFDGVVSDFLVHDGAWLVIEGRQRFYRRDKTASSFELTEGGPTRCLLHLPGDDRAWGCGQPFQNGHFLTSDDGVSWTPVMPFLEVEERRCPAGTVGAERCAYLFPSDGGVVDEEDSGDSGGARVERPGEEPSGCPCSGADGGDLSLATLLLSLLLVRPLARQRRRRR